MREIFLGRPSHWLALAVIAAVLWLVGEYHLHVTQFNWFALIVLGLSVAVLSLVVFRYRPGERVMREPIEDDPSN
jgi:hypothetical protein